MTVPDVGVRTTPRRTGAAEVLACCAELDALSSSPHCLERVYLSPEHAAANAVVGGWMRSAGLRTWQDAAGNQCGRAEGCRPGLPALLLGSHLDTVPDAGSFDGMLGVALAVAVAERLRERTRQLPFALEVVGFGDEEGTRFGTALLGSRALAGTWDDGLWALSDRQGTSLADAFLDFGLDPTKVGDAARRPDQLVGYLEAHIEQGPLLQAADASLGWVTSIAGARRFAITILGEARHAGGTPWEARRDALVGASEAVSAVERLARASDCVATVGQLTVQPGAVNVIPGRVDLSLDLRGATDSERDALWEALHAEVDGQCRRRGLGLQVVETHRAAAVPCDPGLQEAVRAGILVTGDPAPLGLWSRAGHDAMAVAAVTPVAMLFVRCLDGISHAPAEAVRELDVARAIDALEHAVLAVAARVDGAGTEPGAPS